MGDANIVGDTGEKPAGVVHANELLLKMFQLVEPELKGQIQPEESVRKCLQVIENLDAGSSGLFVSHNGDKSRWF